ncbi:hypothetical protein AMIS_65720 [Actinoplanes missouriensis 431]|uniref:Uncharacterized protein n=1 Tax=Actinoplanes missouriensis (strain ATCC 14538 / DSM 43046 / CBS 188.64 / JCM 3121 / NBRC 102363 / NCIMB 12654 / NRRL B-3342 / UNCC 431) TaxID=512565 RepID=I0HFK5_ACTM4|nr:hypothetical protein [Actinoplanes missouriensis]BAL91792.1 hypothetical protein AMIS_65720 [Actinoplanes missouriensis 431]
MSLLNRLLDHGPAPILAAAVMAAGIAVAAPHAAAPAKPVMIPASAAQQAPGTPLTAGK